MTPEQTNEIETNGSYEKGGYHWMVHEPFPLHQVTALLSLEEGQKINSRALFAFYEALQHADAVAHMLLPGRQATIYMFPDDTEASLGPFVGKPTINFPGLSGIDAAGVDKTNCGYVAYKPGTSVQKNGDGIYRTVGHEVGNAALATFFQIEFWKPANEFPPWFVEGLAEIVGLMSDIHRQNGYVDPMTIAELRNAIVQDGLIDVELESIQPDFVDNPPSHGPAHRIWLHKTKGREGYNLAALSVLDTYTDYKRKPNQENHGNAPQFTIRDMFHELHTFTQEVQSMSQERHKDAVGSAVDVYLDREFAAEGARRLKLLRKYQNQWNDLAEQLGLRKPRLTNDYIIQIAREHYGPAIDARLKQLQGDALSEYIDELRRILDSVYSFDFELRRPGQRQAQESMMYIELARLALACRWAEGQLREPTWHVIETEFGTVVLHEDFLAMQDELGALIRQYDPNREWNRNRATETIRQYQEQLGAGRKRHMQILTQALRSPHLDLNETSAVMQWIQRTPENFKEQEHLLNAGLPHFEDNDQLYIHPVHGFGIPVHYLREEQARRTCDATNQDTTGLWTYHPMMKITQYGGILASRKKRGLVEQDNALSYPTSVGTHDYFAYAYGEVLAGKAASIEKQCINTARHEGLGHGTIDYILEEILQTRQGRYTIRKSFAGALGNDGREHQQTAITFDVFFEQPTSDDNQRQYEIGYIAGPRFMRAVVELYAEEQRGEELTEANLDEVWADITALSFKTALAIEQEWSTESNHERVYTIEPAERIRMFFHLLVERVFSVEDDGKKSEIVNKLRNKYNVMGV